jgi:hypothetical protein
MEGGRGFREGSCKDCRPLAQHTAWEHMSGGLFTISSPTIQTQFGQWV